MIKKKVVIVGAGIAGLSAGCYLQINGYDTEIFEAHNIPGGLCTAWNRKGYLIEGCIHGLLGSAPTHPLYKLWNELIEMDKLKFVDAEIKHLYLFEKGRKFIQYANLEKLQKSMIEVAPEDKNVIDEFIKDIKKFQSVQLPWDKPKEFFDFSGKLKMLKALPLLPVMKKWSNISAEDFAKRFKNPLMQDVVKHFSSPILFEMFVLSEMDLKRCGYPAIGSLEFSKLFEKKYLGCGGKIHYNRRVCKVMIQDNRAVGIVLENGEKHYADIVISAADGKTAIYDLLDGMYISETVKKEYDKADLNPSKIHVSLGVNNIFKDWPHTLKVVLPSPYITSDGSEYNSFDVLIYNDVDGLAPENKTLLVVQLDTKNGEYWSTLRETDKDKYQIEKRNIAEDLIGILDSKIGGIKNNIEMTDVATPATYIRYTGNWRGSIQGWSNENIFKANPFKKELPGLEDFFMIGQWVEPGGGVPNAFKSGRDLAQIICKRDKRKFSVALTLF